MGRARGAVVAALAVAVAASSACATSLWYLPRKTDVDHVNGWRRVELRAVPDDAEVSVDGKVVGRTPTSAKLAHKRTRTRRTKRWYFPVAVLVLEVGALALATWTDLDEDLVEDDRNRRLALAAMFVDYSVASILMFKTVEDDELVLTRTVPVPATHAVTYRWDGFGSDTVSVTVPAQVLATAHRSTLGTFDEALIRWDRSTDIAPEPAGALNLGDAYSRLAERTADPAHAARAVHFYEQYLASDAVPPEARRAIEGRLPALRAAAKEAP